MVLEMSAVVVLTILGMLVGFGFLKFLPGRSLIKMVSGLVLTLFIFGSSIAFLGFPELVNLLQTGTLLPAMLALALGIAAGNLLGNLF